MCRARQSLFVLIWYPIAFVASATGILLAITLHKHVRLSLLLPLVIGLGALLGVGISSSYPAGLLLAWVLVAFVGGVSSCCFAIITLIVMRYFTGPPEKRSATANHPHLLALVLSLSSLGFLLVLATKGPALLSIVSVAALVLILSMVGKRTSVHVRNEGSSEQDKE